MRSMIVIRKYYNKGFSLLEILLVLAVAAGIVIAAFIIYPKVVSAKVADSEARRTMSIVAAARSLYTSKANYNGLSLDVLKNADLIDKGMFAKMDGGLPLSEFGTPVTIFPSNANSLFAVEYQQLKKENCVRIIPKIGPGALSIAVNGIDVYSPTKSIDMADVANQCASTTVTTVTFRFN